MKRSLAHRRLIMLNVGLLVALAALTLPNMARGWQQPDRPRGDYTMVSGRVQGSTTHGVYIIDGTNQEVVALNWDRNTNRFTGIGYRNLVNDGRTQAIGR